MATYYLDSNNASGGRNGSISAPWNSWSDTGIVIGAHTYYVEENSSFALTEPVNWTNKTGAVNILPYKAGGGTVTKKPTFTNTTTVASGAWTQGVAMINNSTSSIEFFVPGESNYEMLYFTAYSAVPAPGNTITQGGVTATVVSKTGYTTAANSSDKSGTGWCIIQGRNTEVGNFTQGAATASGGKTLTLHGPAGAHLWFCAKRLDGSFGGVLRVKAGPTGGPLASAGLYMPRPFGAQVETPDKGEMWRGMLPDSSIQCSYNGTEGSIVYSPTGNPTTVFGTVKCSAYSDANLTSGNGSGAALVFKYHEGRITIRGMKFEGVLAAVDINYAKSAFYEGMSEGIEVSGCELTHSGPLINFRSWSGYDNSAGKEVTAAEWACGGYPNTLIADNYCHDLAEGIVANVGGGWAAMDGTRVIRNVINDSNRVTSSGAIYTGGWHIRNNSTDPTKRIEFAYNSICGVRRGFGFVGEGYGIYHERNCHGITTHHNFIWDCDRAIQNNGSGNSVNPIICHSNYSTLHHNYPNRVGPSGSAAGMFQFTNSAGKLGCTQIVRNNINNGDSVFGSFGDNSAYNRGWELTFSNNISIVASVTGLDAFDSAFCNWQKDTTKATSYAITGATKANPVVLTVNNHGFSTGNTVWVDNVGGMTEINGARYTVTKVDANRISLQGINGVSYTTYTSGGICVPSSSDSVVAAVAKTNPCVVTVPNHPWATGDRVYLTAIGGISSLTDKFYTVTRVNADKVSLDGVNGTGFGAYTGGGRCLPGVFTLSGNYGNLHSAAVVYKANNLNNEGLTVADKTAVVAPFFPVPTDRGNVNYAQMMPKLTTEWDLSLANPFGSAPPTDTTLRFTGLVPANVRTSDVDPGGLEVEVTGVNFKNGDIFKFDGTNCDTVFVSAETLTATIPAAKLATPGTFLCRVYRSSTVKSETRQFAVYPPRPVITSLDPSSVVEDSGSFALTVTGDNFADGYVIVVNDEEQVTVWADPDLTCTVDGAYITDPGDLLVQINGGAAGMSDGETIAIGTPAPSDPVLESIYIEGAINPTEISVGTSEFTIVALGSNFAEGDRIRVGGTTNLDTTFVTSGQLEAVADSTWTATEATYSVKVNRDGTKYGKSFFSVVKYPEPPPPTLRPPEIIAINPSSVTEVVGNFTLKIDGNYFVDGQQAYIDEEARTTTYVAATETDPAYFEVDVLEADTAGRGGARVAVYLLDATEGASNPIYIDVAQEEEPAESEVVQIVLGISVFGS